VAQPPVCCLGLRSLPMLPCNRAKGDRTRGDDEHRLWLALTSGQNLFMLSHRKLKFLKVESGVISLVPSLLPPPSCISGPSSAKLPAHPDQAYLSARDPTNVAVAHQLKKLHPVTTTEPSSHGDNSPRGVGWGSLYRRNFLLFEWYTCTYLKRKTCMRQCV
jgi:hypothetical protein